jgi:hypothetical protein
MMTRSAGSRAILGISCFIACRAVAPEKPCTRHEAGRPVRRASVRAVTAVID